MTYIAPIRAGLTPAQYFTAANKGLSDKMYNVEDFGAVHDGITDDTEKIQDAINYCFAAGGGSVYLSNGTYIISGALKNGIGGIDYNSQLYIPHSPANAIIKIRLIGESVNWLPAVHFNTTQSGVVLKSTIAGTGVFPSVITSIGTVGTYGSMNYTDCEIENVKIIVDAFEATTGPSMCGINFLYASTSYLNNVIATIDCNILNSIIPENHVFGIATGVVNNDFPRIGKIIASGFYYGVIIGEGVYADTIHAYFNYIGLMANKSAYPSQISYAVLHWNAYDIASQQETFYGIARHDCRLSINSLASEDGYSGDNRTPSWCYAVDTINDDVNLIKGYVDYQLSGEGGIGLDVVKAHGGHNLIMRNMYKSQTYKWTSTTRPNISATSGIVGYNSTINKMECWDGSSWVALT
jgi:hypothetical protein